MKRALSLILLGWLCWSGSPLAAGEADWHDAATGRTFGVTLHGSTAPDGETRPLAVYLTGLAEPRVGTLSDERLIAELAADGLLVARIDFGGEPSTAGPELHRWLGRLRDDLQARRWLAQTAVDLRRVFLVPAGCRLVRDVVFFRDDPAGRVLAMDLVHPAEPLQTVPAVLEFSCDNRDRMSNTSLSLCSDTLLDGLAAQGFAVAMADHPVAPPYRGLDPMPDSAWKAKAAVRTLRAESGRRGLSGRIGVVGFSRGSGLALLLVTTAGRPELEWRGENVRAGLDSAVQAAVVLSGRFTYLDLRPDDPMIPRYMQAWGDPHASAEAAARWRDHGALDHLQGPAAVPLFLSINATESPHALHQMQVLRERLRTLGSAFVDFPELTPRGHKVPLDVTVLRELRAYLEAQLGAPHSRTSAGPTSTL